MKIVIIAVVAGYNIYTNLKSNTVSDLMLANVEALANDESSEPCEEVCYPCSGWKCTRILGGVSSVCYSYRKK